MHLRAPEKEKESNLLSGLLLHLAEYHLRNFGDTINVKVTPQGGLIAFLPGFPPGGSNSNL